MRACVLLLVVLFAMAYAAAIAQQNPTQFANVAVDNCGRVGELLSQNEGTGTRNGQTTHYASASFAIACDNAQGGLLDIQLADNQPVVVTYRQDSSSADATSLKGPDARLLVEQAIRGVCACTPQ